MLKIKVPATSANLGPGYDSFGLALNLFNEYIFNLDDSKSELSVQIINDNNLNLHLKDEDNLILNTVKYLDDLYPDKIKTSNLEIKALLNYPINRGLGSSANAIIGTVVGLNKLFDLNLTSDEILKAALHLEGHPDNIVPTLSGGFTISKVENETILYEKFTISNDFKILLLIPDFAIKTIDARQVLNNHIEINHASQNIANASLLSAGLIQGDLSLIKKGSHDYIHQSKRLSINKKLEKLFTGLKDKLSCPYFLSGSGSTIIFISNKEFSQEKEIINKTADKYGIVNYLIETKVNNKGIIIKEDGD